MPIIVEWIDYPHIIQITCQGKFTLDEIADGSEQIVAMHLANPARPFCILGTVLPDRQLPVGLLNLATHPSITSALKYADAAAIVGVDHFMIGMLVEMLSRLPGSPHIHMVKSYDEGLHFLRQVVNAKQAGL